MDQDDRQSAAKRDQPATIKEVARLAGVAASSVSRALNDHPDVSEDMKARVRRAAEQLTYQPDFLAQSLRIGATHTVGFIVRDIANPLFAGIVKGAERLLDAHGYSILLMNSLGDPSLDAKHISVLRQRRVDGFILTLQSETESETRRSLERCSVPIVLLDRDVEGIAADAVLVDHFTGIKEATTELVRLGHRRVTLILGPANTRSSRERARGFRAACKEAGRSIDSKSCDIFETDSYSVECGLAATEEILSRRNVPTAVIAGNSQLGVGVLYTLSERGINVGGGVSLVICDDIELLRLMQPAISVIAHDPEQMGAVAAQLLLDRFEDREARPRNVVLETRYIARGSSSPPGMAVRTG